MSRALYNKNTDIPQDMILGNLIFMALTDMKIPQNDLIDIFKNHNISEQYIRKIFPADAFRRATSNEKNRTITITNNKGETINAKIEVDEVRCDSLYIKRILGIKDVDYSNEDIGYTPVIDVVLNRQTNQVSSAVRAAGYQNIQVYQQICTDIETNYQDWSVYHNKTTIRNLVNRIITSTHPINLMPTGLCKFTPNISSDLMYNLKSALQEMESYSIGTKGHNIMEIIPVLDTEEQRSVIEKNFVREVTDEMSTFIIDLKTAISGNTSLSTRTANSYIEKFNYLKDKVSDYEQLLGVYVNSINTQLKQALQMVQDNKED